MTKQLIIFLVFFALLSTGLFFVLFHNKTIEISNLSKETPNATITPQPDECDYQRRPIAVMLPSDTITRPLSGIGEANLVFEMPVNPQGVTRLMAVFQCTLPNEIGSIRSARKDFVPLAATIDALYAHWGGEYRTLEILNNNVLDNIDGLKYENIYYFRKSNIPKPHNGFTSATLLKKAIQELGYRTEKKKIAQGIATVLNAPPSPIPSTAISEQPTETTITIPYAKPFTVSWMYDTQSKTYKRFRNNTPELDYTTNKQITADTVIVMKTTSSQVNVDYMDVNTTGTGKALLYQQGQSIQGTWQKLPTPLNSPLQFFDTQGNEIQLSPGKTWVELIL